MQNHIQIQRIFVSPKSLYRNSPKIDWRFWNLSVINAKEMPPFCDQISIISQDQKLFVNTKITE